MSTAPDSNNQYQVGGSLNVNHPTYVERQADKDFYEKLKEGKFCYVLNSRQTGKSSLRVRTMQKLQAENIICIGIDMSTLCESEGTSEQWCAGLLYQLTPAIKGVAPKFLFTTWFEDHNHLPPLEYLKEFVETELLQKITQHNIVIFIDEIDSLIGFVFKTYFFNFIHDCYNKRAENPNYKRLNFALLGVANPSDLIEDQNRTPFNDETTAIELTGFKLEETEPLQKVLAGKIKNINPKIVLEAVLEWTGGQPLLTQWLCELIQSNHSNIQVGNEKKCINDLVQPGIIDNWLLQKKDKLNHFQTICYRLLNSNKSAQLLAIYNNILLKGKIIANGSDEEIELQLTGLVVCEEKHLRVYNKIYKYIFDASWVKIELEKIVPYSDYNKTQIKTDLGNSINLEYKVGGSLDADHPTYVERQADKDLYNELKERKYCYVLNSRQMGKSSLRIRTIQKLENEKLICVGIDISALCESGAASDLWYASFLNQFVPAIKKINPNFSLTTWLEEYKHLSQLEKLRICFETELLVGKNSGKNIVIFIDEIDTLIDLPSVKNDFFKFIRDCSNKRADKPNSNYKRLTFALMGVANSSDLIGDITKVPFNQPIAEIELTGFKLEETEPLQKVLVGKISNPEIVLKAVLEWTGGQPFLTQWLCELIQSNHSDIQVKNEKKCINDLVQSNIIQNWLSQKKDKQNHFQTICDRLLKSNKSAQLLAIYKNILLNEKIGANGSDEEIELRLTGLVVCEEGHLRVYNEIYKSVFDKSWVEKELKKIPLYLEPNNSEVETEIEKLYKGLKAGDFCYVLSSQISEKNKFLRQTEKFIEDKNIQFAILDPQKVYKQDWDRKWTERHSWYLIVAEIINEEFNLDYPPRKWWKDKDNKHLERDANRGQKLLITYIENWLLTKIKEPNVVIIFDSFLSRNEADIVKYRHLFDIDGLDFKDDIFNFICLCYEKRKINHNFKRLTFLLLDVIMNPEFIREDIKNIIVGWRTNLGNTYEQKVELIIAHGLNQKFKNTNYKILLNRILYWTSGHPFIIQKLLHLVLREQSNVTPGKEDEYVDSLINQKIIIPFKSA